MFDRGAGAVYRLKVTVQEWPVAVEATNRING